MKDDEAVTDISKLRRASPVADIPVACTVSGLIYLLEAVTEVNQGEGELARRAIEVRGVNARVTGLPCAACRTNVSTDRWTEKASTCEYRPLRGPLFVPR